MRSFFVGLFLLLSLPCTVVAGDKVVNFDPNDPVMNDAIHDARQTLPQFLANVFITDKAAGNASLKVAMPFDNNGGNEIIWINGLTQQGNDGYQGQLANSPVNLDRLSFGDTVRFSSDQIRDWSYTHPQTGKLFGHYTTRVVIQHIDPAQRREVEAILGNPPVPSDW